MNWTRLKIWATITHDHELKISKNMSQIHELNWTERKWSAISFIFSHLCTTHACARTYVLIWANKLDLRILSIFICIFNWIFWRESVKKGRKIYQIEYRRELCTTMVQLVSQSSECSWYFYKRGYDTRGLLFRRQLLILWGRFLLYKPPEI